MKKALATQIARLWNEHHSNYTSGTTTFATEMDNLSEFISNTDDLFSSTMCWSCKHIYLDLSNNRKEYRCHKTGKVLKHNICLPTKCKGWVRD